jgi:membrane protein
MLHSAKFWIRDKIEHLKSRIYQIKERLLKIPAVRLVVHTIQELQADDATHMAAGVSYYAILSLFPLILALVAVLGIFLPSETIQEEIFSFFERNLPGTVDVLKENIEQVIQLRGAIGIVGIVLLLWTASAMFGAVSRTINRAWDVHQDRPFHIRKLRDLSMALGISILFFLSLGATSIYSILRSTDLPVIGTALDVGARLLAFLPSFAIFLILYKFIPNTKTYWRYVWPGALLAAVLFEISKSIFILYLDRFATYELVYGSIGSVIALLVWIYVAAFILILGAEFSAEYGRMRMGVAKGVLIATHLEQIEQTGSVDEQKGELT